MLAAAAGMNRAGQATEKLLALSVTTLFLSSNLLSDDVVRGCLIWCIKREPVCGRNAFTDDTENSTSNSATILHIFAIEC